MALAEYQQKIFARLGYEPRKLQWQILLDTHRVKQVVGGERAGKSHVGAKLVFLHIPLSKLIWIVGQEYANCRQEFEYVLDDCATVGIVKGKPSFPHEGPCSFETMNGCRIETKSAQDPTKLGMYPPDFILVCEAAQISYEAFLRLRGRIAEKRGEMVLTGTFEGCLAGDTLVATSDGIKKITEVAVGDKVSGLASKAEVSATFNNGLKKTVSVILDKGFQITGTLNHRIVVRLPDGSVTWKELDKVAEEDLVAIRYGSNIYGQNHLTPDDAYFIGVYIAEGCCSQDGRITITSNDTEIVKRACPGYYQHGYHWRLTDHPKVKLLRDTGVDIKWKARTKEVPIGILCADKETQVNFLQGLFDGDGSVTKHGVVYYTSLEKLAQQVQFMLLNMGVLSTVNKRICKLNGKDFDSYTLSVCDAADFVKHVNFYLAYSYILLIMLER